MADLIDYIWAVLLGAVIGALICGLTVSSEYRKSALSHGVAYYEKETREFTWRDLP